MAKIPFNISHANTLSLSLSLFSPSDQLSFCLTGLSRPANRRHGGEWRFSGILPTLSLYHEYVHACLFLKPFQTCSKQTQLATACLVATPTTSPQDCEWYNSQLQRIDLFSGGNASSSQHSTLQFWAPSPWMHSRDAKDWFSQFATVAGLMDSRGDN